VKKWKPAPGEAVAALETSTSRLSGVEPRKMFVGGSGLAISLIRLVINENSIM